MKRTPKSSNEASEQSPKKGRAKTSEKPKGLGLFDHVKHIRSVQDPDYFDSLTELDLKSFNQFMILRALSMNPELLDDIAMLYRYLEVKIPNRQFYKLLITLIPADRRYYPWVKTKKKPFSKSLLELMSKWFEVSTDEAEEYATILSRTEKGKQELFNICQGFGLSNKDVEKILANDEED